MIILQAPTVDANVRLSAPTSSSCVHTTWPRGPAQTGITAAHLAGLRSRRGTGPFVGSLPRHSRQNKWQTGIGVILTEKALGLGCLAVIKMPRC